MNILFYGNENRIKMSQAHPSAQNLSAINLFIFSADQPIIYAGYGKSNLFTFVKNLPVKFGMEVGGG